MNTHFGEFLPVGWTLGIDAALWSEYLIAYLDIDQSESSAATPHYTSSTTDSSQHHNARTVHHATQPAGQPAGEPHSGIVARVLRHWWRSRRGEDSAETVTLDSTASIPARAQGR